MIAKKTESSEPPDPTIGLASVNEVRLRGRLSSPAAERAMPSGDLLSTFRVLVHRLEADARGRRRVDALDCHTWSPKVRKQASGWRVGDVVELEGSLRRRFFRTGSGTQSVTEVEVFSARVVRRATT